MVVIHVYSQIVFWSLILHFNIRVLLLYNMELLLLGKSTTPYTYCNERELI
ncbi:unnamed protein product [Schistosoma mattheei]|uniref:Uncharacterized protein n=1 Tax=Schistosoma mattheei TaxID=31246 RepID=A0A3P8HC65_9TREM|nr:unnamed protein product [Schistosoma mattheei]